MNYLKMTAVENSVHYDIKGIKREMSNKMEK